MYVAEGNDHAALFTESALLAAPHWVSGEPPPLLMQVGHTARRLMSSHAGYGIVSMASKQFGSSA